MHLGGLLGGASWEPLGVLLGAIRGLKMSIFTQVLQTFPLVDAFADDQLQALAPASLHFGISGSRVP